ncbi:hypothetical protein DMENIID0001_088110 [Sergentomyia squamirostris]
MLCFLAAVEFLRRKWGFLLQEDRPILQRWAIYLLGRIIAGLIMSLIFWYLIIYANLETSKRSFKILLLLVLIFCTVAILEKTARCIFLLISVQSFGKAGRSILKTILFSLIFTGPVSNLTKNILEINRVFVCSSRLALNLSKAHIDLMILPFQSAIDGLQNTSAVKDNFNFVNEVVDPFVDEVESNTTQTDPKDPKDPKEISENYSKKLSQRCSDQIQKARTKCNGTFTDLHKSCADTVPDFLVYSLCWMMDSEAVCYSRMENQTEEFCTPENIVNETFGSQYLDLLEERDGFVNEVDSVQVNYTYNESNWAIRDTDDYKAELEKILNEKKNVINYVLILTNFLLAFTYLKVLLRSCFYLYSFFMELDFENKYITSAFRDIDEDRADRGERTLLPLKKNERKTLIDPREKRRIEDDYRNLIYHLLKMILEVVAVSVFLILDWLLVIALEIVAAHGEVDFAQHGEVQVNVTISGDGIMASVVSDMINGLGVNQTVDWQDDNAECLPDPVKLSSFWYFKIYGMFLMILILIYNESYSSRLLLLTCAFFYPERQVERSVFLYKKILQGRRDRFRHMKKRMEHEEEEEDWNYLWIFEKLRNLFPERRRCRLCRDVEVKPGLFFKEIPRQFVECPEEDCRTVYCEECWVDLEGVCVVCDDTESFM